MLIDSKALARAIETHRVFYGNKSRERTDDQLVEECAEVIQAIKHVKRGRAEDVDVVKELADVLICIELYLDANNIPRLILDTAIVEASDSVHERLTELMNKAGEDTQVMERPPG